MAQKRVKKSHPPKEDRKHSGRHITPAKTQKRREDLKKKTDEILAQIGEVLEKLELTPKECKRLYSGAPKIHLCDGREMSLRDLLRRR